MELRCLHQRAHLATTTHAHARTHTHAGTVHHHLRQGGKASPLGLAAFLVTNSAPLSAIAAGMRRKGSRRDARQSGSCIDPHAVGTMRRRMSMCVMMVMVVVVGVQVPCEDSASRTSLRKLLQATQPIVMIARGGASAGKDAHELGTPASRVHAGTYRAGRHTSLHHQSRRRRVGG